MLNITDPQVQAQLQSDYNRGAVPQWNPSDRDAAYAFAAYYNELLQADDVVQIEEVVTYKIKIVPPQG